MDISIIKLAKKDHKKQILHHTKTENYRLAGPDKWTKLNKRDLKN
jgi:hypothetical protein